MDGITITPKAYQDTLNQWVLLDVREDSEVTADPVPLCPPVMLHIPMGEISCRLDEIDPDKPLVVICHHGVRSHRVAEFLLNQGYQALSLVGGTSALHDAIDKE